MSHIVQIQTEIRDGVALEAACRRLQLPVPVHGTAKLFSGEATGLAILLPGWKYPVVCDTAAGTLRFDNFEGRWGEREKLNLLMQAYACEKAKIEGRKRGHTVTEQALADGSIKVTVQVGSAT